MRQGYPTETFVRFLKNHGTLVLLLDPKKTLLPKLEFFYSKGFTSPNIAGVLSRSPTILDLSLENHIVPSFVFFKYLFGTDVDIVTAIKRFSGILCSDLDTYVANINTLRENGVPESYMVKFLKTQPRVFMTDSVRFRRTVEELKEMGFDPLKVKFVEAVYAMSGMSKSTWERKVNAYRRWGLSEVEILCDTFKKEASELLKLYEKKGDLEGITRE
jgi:mTERF domain-containing protein